MTLVVCSFTSRMFLSVWVFEDVSEVLVCYSLGAYETQSNPQANRVIA